MRIYSGNDIILFSIVDKELVVLRKSMKTADKLWKTMIFKGKHRHL